MFSLLVTGLVREPFILARTLLEWRDAPGRFDEIVISTWESEIPKFQAVLAMLGPTLPPPIFVVNQEPMFELALPGNFLHQRLTLLNGALRCSNDRIFKIRSDIFVSSALWPVFEKTWEQRVEGPLKAFERKMWTPWIDYEQIFHIADEALFASRNDLLKLCSSDISDFAEFGYPLANSHSMLFRPPYGVTGRVFRDWNKAQRQASILLDDVTFNKFRRLAGLLRNESYQRVMGVYHRYLIDNLVVESDPGQLSFRPGGGASGIYYFDRQLDAAPEPKLFAREFAGFSNHFFVWKQASLERLVAGARRDGEMSAYAAAFENPQDVVSIRDDSLLEDLVAALTALA